MQKTENNHSLYGVEVEMCPYDKQAEFLTRFEVEIETLADEQPPVRTIGVGCYLTLPVDIG